ncbi:RICIN domain-containing protein [Peribacillus frigoritolerans]|uniref:RICIN domain-containing protein n=1 Tax=Peribacillus castrilensis TaxID=2897690 RepID=UPI003DA3BB1C
MYNYNYAFNPYNVSYYTDGQREPYYDNYYQIMPDYSPSPYLYYPTYIDARTVYPVNTYYAYPSYFDYRYYSVPTYPINEADFYLEASYPSDRQSTISLQNAANTKWEGHYLDIDGNTGQVILWPRLGSGGYWKLTDHGNGTVSLQNAANTKWKDHYLDIDGNTGQVILWPSLGSGGYWKLTDHGNGTVSLQNAANTKWKDHYLDIDGNTGQVILWPSLGSGGYWKRTNQDSPSLVKRFPITTSQHTELGDHRRMETSITISSNGRVDGRTKTWTSKKWEGFTGYVHVTFYDANNEVVDVPPFPTIQYGVSGTATGGHKREETWLYRIPPEQINKVTKASILHSVRPTPRITPQNFKEWSDVLTPLIKELKPAPEVPVE